MKTNYISIDGGGTKTEVCIYNAESNIMSCKLYDGMNINQIGVDKFELRVQEILYDINDIKNSVFCIGVPGYGESAQNDEVIHKVIFSYINKEDCIIVNDVELAHYSSFALNDGLLILSGTGSMLFSILDGKIKRAGGWGYLVGDEGSGFDIGHKAIKHLSHVFDFKSSSSILSNLIINEYGISAPCDLIDYIYSSTNYRKDVAKLSRAVIDAAEMGCEISKQIIDESSEYFVSMINKITDNKKVRISYAGGMFNSSVFKKSIEEKGEFIFSDPELPPVLGGILKLCMISEANKEELVCSLNIMYNDFYNS